MKLFEVYHQNVKTKGGWICKQAIRGKEGTTDMENLLEVRQYRQNIELRKTREDLKRKHETR